MGIDAIRKQWRESKLVIDSDDIIRHYKRELCEREVILCKCPCGGLDHYASIFLIKEGYSQYESDILNCFKTEKQWIIRRRPIVSLIYDEEKMYIQLLKRSKPIVEKIVAKRGASNDTKRFLYETHGIPEDIFDEVTKQTVI